MTGVGHLLIELLAPVSPERASRMATMRGWRLELPGAERSVEELFLGFSLLMGLLLVGAGALLATMRPTRAGQLVAAGLTALVAGVAWCYLFAVPGVLTSIAAVAALGAVVSGWPRRATAS